MGQMEEDMDMVDMTSIMQPRRLMGAMYMTHHASLMLGEVIEKQRRPKPPIELLLPIDGVYRLEA